MGRDKRNARTIWIPRDGDRGDLALDFDDGRRRHTHHGMVIPDYETISITSALKIARTDNLPRPVRIKAVDIAEKWGKPGQLSMADRWLSRETERTAGVKLVATNLGTTSTIAYFGMDDAFTAKPTKGLGTDIWSPDRHQAIRVATEVMASMAGSVEALMSIEHERM